jgi:fatty acid desaturase
MKCSKVTFCAWILILTFSLSLIFQIKSSYNDAVRAFGNNGRASLAIVLTAFFYAIPLAFSIALLKRKNWARIGIMIFSLLAIATSFYTMFHLHAFYIRQMVWILFFFIVFMILRSERFKREFHNNF